MSKLERWNPFKFRRKKAEEKQQTLRQDTVAAGTTLAKAPVGAATGPFAPLFQDLWRDPFFRAPMSVFGDMERWFGDFAPAHFRPAVDVVDEDKAIKVTAELPGLTKDELQVELNGDYLTLRGEKKNESEREENGAFRTERFYGYFERTTPLPADLDRDRLEATFDNGVLSVRIPKAASSKGNAKVIEVK